MNQLVVRWTDDKGIKQTKEYSDENVARKARDWLTDNGVKDADIAIVMKKKPEPTDV